MNIKAVLSSIIFAGLVSVTTPLLACGDAACNGTCAKAALNKQVGNVVQIDQEEGTFTIEDTQSYTAITFNASADILAEADQAQGQVIVMYSDDGAGFTAKSVNFN